MKNLAAVGCMVLLLAVVLTRLLHLAKHTVTVEQTHTMQEKETGDWMAQMMRAISPAYGGFSLGLLMLGMWRLHRLETVFLHAF